MMSSIFFSYFPYIENENRSIMMTGILLNAGAQMKVDQNRLKMVSRKAEYYVVITFLILPVFCINL